MAERRELQPDLFNASGPESGGGECLRAWQPGQWPVAPDWQPTVDVFLRSPPGQGLAQFMDQRLAADVCIYPPNPLRALALTPLAEVRVVIMGQDPYHGPGQAEGLAFSVAAGMALPPSLRNIFKELARAHAQGNPDAPQRPAPADGSLVRWAQQGVLLLNTCMTVERGQPASHANRGWEFLADAVLRAVLADGRPVVFMLWGAHAQKMARLLGDGQAHHAVLTANHPSPLSALRPPQPFIGCNHFSLANAFLAQFGQKPVIW